MAPVNALRVGLVLTVVRRQILATVISAPTAEDVKTVYASVLRGVPASIANLARR